MIKNYNELAASYDDLKNKYNQYKVDFCKDYNGIDPLAGKRAIDKCLSLLEECRLDIIEVVAAREEINDENALINLRILYDDFVNLKNSLEYYLTRLSHITSRNNSRFAVLIASLSLVLGILSFIPILFPTRTSITKPTILKNEDHSAKSLLSDTTIKNNNAVVLDTNQFKPVTIKK